MVSGPPVACWWATIARASSPGVEVTRALRQPLDRRREVGLSDRLALGDELPGRARTPRSPRAYAARCRGWRRGRRAARPSSPRRPRGRLGRRHEAGLAQASDPKRRCIAWRPARTPGTAHAAAPMWNTCVVCSSNGTSTRSTSASLRSGGRLLARDRRERVEDVDAPRPCRAAPSGTRRRTGPVSPGSAAHDIAPAATTASTAFPPCSSTRAAARAVTAWPAATAALMERDSRAVQLRKLGGSRLMSPPGDWDAAPGRRRAAQSRSRRPSPTSGPRAARRRSRRR